jgi:hypothetical protein
MKLLPLTHVTWALATVVAFGLGIMVSDNDSRTSATKANPQRGAHSTDGIKAESAPSAEVPPKQTESLEPLTQQNTKVRTFQILSENNRLERIRQMCELLRQVTPGNWKEVVEAFRRQTIAQGRTHGDLWDLMLERVGEVAGATAVAEMATSTDVNEQKRAGTIFKGWAATNPKEAVQWFNQQSAELQSKLFTGMRVE